MPRNIVRALDVGTNTIKAVVAEARSGEELRILGVALVASDGVRRGQVVRPQSLIPRIKEAAREAERSSGVSFRQVYLAFGSPALASHRTRGRIPISTGSGEVARHDLERVLKEAQPPRAQIQNREVLGSFPLNFTVDDEPPTHDPLGIRGESLEAEVLAVTALKKPLSDLIKTAEEAGLAVEDIIPAPLALGRSLLAPQLSEVGGAAVDIGAETLGLAVFEENLPLSLTVFNLGSSSITNDLALGFQVSLQEAEKLKLSGEGPENTAAAKRKHGNIVEARLEDMLELVQNHLKKIGRAGLLPGGVVFGGGGARIGGLAEFARNALKLPGELGKCQGVEPSHKLRDPLWAVAVGTLLLAGDAAKASELPLKKPSALAQQISSWFKSLIP